MPFKQRCKSLTVLVPKYYFGIKVYPELSQFTELSSPVRWQNTGFIPF